MFWSLFNDVQVQLSERSSVSVGGGSWFWLLIRIAKWNPRIICMKFPDTSHIQGVRVISAIIVTNIFLFTRNQKYLTTFFLF